MASIPYTNAAPDSVPQYSGLRSPHESVAQEPVVGAIKTEPDIVKIVKRLYEQSKVARKARESQWTEYWDYYNGKQWPKKRAINKAMPNVNVIRPIVQTVLPIMTDTSPSFGVIARDYKDYKFAELLTDVLSVWWKRRSMNHVLTESIMDSLVTDVGIMKVVYNEDLDDSLGDVEVIVCDPKRVFVPKNAVDFDRNCPWVIHEFYKSRGFLTIKFPKSREMIKSAPTATDVGETSEADTRVRVVSPVDRDVPAPDNRDAASVSISSNDDIRVWEAWIDDDTTIEEERINEDTNESETVVKKKYPHGRMITMLPDCADGVLQDIDNPFRDGEKPFVRIVSTLEPRSFYGVGDVGPLIEIQRMINKTFATILDWSNMMVNNNWIVDDDSGVDPDMLTNQMGQVIVKRRGTTVARDSAPPLPAQVFELHHTLMTILDQQSGVHDVTQGRKPAGVTAAQAIETLQEAAQTRIRLKERNLLTSLHRLGMLIISRMLQYYTEPRVIELTGRDDRTGDWPNYVKFYVEQIDEDGDVMYRPVTRDVEYNPEADEYIEGDAMVGEPTIGQFELDITTGTSLPFIKQQRSDQAIRLFENKSIDQKALLDVLEFPDKDGVMNRMSAEQSAAQPQAPGGPAMAIGG